MLSYNGKVLFGMASDERLVPEPLDIVNLFHEEVETLAKFTQIAR